jgi:hypothetical protein
MNNNNSEAAVAYDEQNGTHFDYIMTDRQMAEELGVPLATLRYWWSCGGGPPSFKAGKFRRGLRSTFFAWCAERQAFGSK